MSFFSLLMKNVMKSYTRNGYKQITFMIFGELAAKEISTIRHGTIMSLINPKLM